MRPSLTTALAIALGSLLLTGQASAEPLPGPNWERAAAVRAAASHDGNETLADWFALARAGRDRELLASLHALTEDDALPAPARERLLHAFAIGLADLDPGSVEEAVLDYLVRYQPGVLVPHDDHPQAGVPLYNLRAAVAGLRASWERRQAEDVARALLAGGAPDWTAAWLSATPARRAGFADAAVSADATTRERLAEAVLAGLPAQPELADLAARIGAAQSDADLLAGAAVLGSGPGVSAALRAAGHLDEASRTGLLLRVLAEAPEGNQALAIALLGPGLLRHSDASAALLDALERPDLASTAAMALLASDDPGLQEKARSTLQSSHGHIVEWVEDAPSSDTSKIALGYPVPLPVDTALPFDGFRSYAGLQARHQELADSTPWAHPAEIGTTRQGRTIRAYRLGDADRETAWGLPEPAMLTNGGIHAREWQSPEVATGIMEYLAGAQDDPLVDYLRDNANVIVIPVHNIDGFLQTQRYPAHNWLDTDPDDPESSPRDGRMRRKNMLGPDEDLSTQADHLLGVDLNRNNPPYWATAPGRSSSSPDSLVHHGSAPHSEPETQALRLAAELGPADRLSLYTDMHSFSQVHFWVRTNNGRLAQNTERLLGSFSNFHAAFPAGKFYAYSSAANVPWNSGIGTTDEWFTVEYEVPSWTLEIEPSNGASYHAPLPGAGADYGGLGRNGHDGFILPESQITRVREELARSFAIAYYRQSGPPSVTTVRLSDAATGAVVFEAEWDTLDAGQRQLYRYQAQPLQFDRDYRAWVAFDKPMRWRVDDEVAPLPGQPGSTLDFDGALLVNRDELAVTLLAADWLAQPGEAPDGYQRYRDDAVDIAFRVDGSETNRALVGQGAAVTLRINTTDMTGLRTDADPATVAHWDRGGWNGYEDAAGGDGNDLGGPDRTVALDFTPSALVEPFVIEPGTSSAWFDPQRNGEGFMLEILPAGRAVMYWFTYDTAGEQDWYVAEGEIRGNRIVFPELLRVSGGEFGPGFDPARVTRAVVGSAAFIWSSCEAGAMDWVIDGDGGPRRHGRMNLERLSRVMGIPCGAPTSLLPEGGLSGSWYDPSHNGEGYVLEVLDDERALVYWFSYDAEGRRRWFFGTTRIDGGALVFDEMYTTAGGVFGAGFDPALVEVMPWGALSLDLDCAGGAADFQPTEAGFPAGTLQLVRLSQLDGISCGD